MNNPSTLLAALSKAATVLASEIKNKTSGGQHPNGLSESVVIGKAESIGSGKFSISISIKHPAAAAYEYGSGIHATKGIARKYKISPKNASLLAFPWQPSFVPWASRKFAGVILDDPDSTKGKYFFNYVEHPGVEARPYARPSISAKKVEIAKLLGRAFVISVTGKTNKIEEIK